MQKESCFKILATFVVAATPLRAFSHTHYCDHIHHPGGGVTWQCDDSRWTAKAICDGTDLQGNRVGATLTRKYDGFGGTSPSSIWEWRIESKMGAWELTLFAGTQAAVCTAHPKTLTEFYPPEYSGKYSHVGSSDHFCELARGGGIRLSGMVRANLPDRPMPNRFDFFLYCKSVNQ